MSGLPPPTSASSKLNTTEGMIYPPLRAICLKIQIRSSKSCHLDSRGHRNLAARKHLAHFSASEMLVERAKRAAKASKY